MKDFKDQIREKLLPGVAVPPAWLDPFVVLCNAIVNEILADEGALVETVEPAHKRDEFMDACSKHYLRVFGNRDDKMPYSNFAQLRTRHTADAVLDALQFSPVRKGIKNPSGYLVTMVKNRLLEVEQRQDHKRQEVDRDRSAATQSVDAITARAADAEAP